MNLAVGSAAMPDAAAVSERLNRECFCITLDEEALCQALLREVGDPAFFETWIRTRPHLFSRAPVFLPERELARMHRVVRAIEAASRLPGYRDAALAVAPAIAERDPGPRGAFMGYDFHLGADGPKLIEINTNAGGAFLNAALARAQRACCAEMSLAPAGSGADGFDAAVLSMLRREWALQRGSGAPRRIAIVDDRPSEQYLYPEFVLAERLLQQHGLDAVIADAAALRYEGGELSLKGRPIDLVYNRLVDFALEQPEHAALRAAYLDGAAVVTPGPHVHALLADKRNLVLLSDPGRLQGWGLPPDMLADLAAAVPRTTLVTADNADRLWQARRELFFKPAAGHGSKAVYRGDKLTRSVWSEIRRGCYVAQAFAQPSERVVEIDGARASRKADFRLYAYDGEVLLAAARLYQGQATNFRTPGGGFAPVIVV